ncbi:MAG TPA: hypothetical protein VKG44_07340 [Candidatus Baltobacteraceae bacterium]|nr:hypothetical protein [Candidatus Baltobacteraceae bacterium]
MTGSGSLARLGFGPADFSSPAATLRGFDAFSQSAYRHADEIRRALAPPPGAGAANPTPATSPAATLAAFLGSAAGHAALEKTLERGAKFVTSLFADAREAVQLALPLE